MIFVVCFVQTFVLAKPKTVWVKLGNALLKYPVSHVLLLCTDKGHKNLDNQRVF